VELREALLERAAARGLLDLGDLKFERPGLAFKLLDCEAAGRVCLFHTLR